MGLIQNYEHIITYLEVFIFRSSVEFFESKYFLNKL